MHVLVTGASGLIGRAAVRTLLGRGHAVTALHRHPLSERGAAELIYADVRTPEARRAAARADAVLHMAGSGDVQASWEDPRGSMDVHIGGTLNLLAGVRESGGALVIPSTQRIYRPARRPLRETDRAQPADPYSVAKLAAEGVCRVFSERYHLAIRATRLFSVYGPEQRGQGASGVVAIFADRARAGADLVVEPGPRRDFTYVDDAALGLSLALERARAGFRIYNVATGQGTSLETLAAKIAALYGSRSRVIVSTERWERGDYVADIARARRELGFEPRVAVDDGLRVLKAARR